MSLEQQPSLDQAWLWLSVECNRLGLQHNGTSPSTTDQELTTTGAGENASEKSPPSNTDSIMEESMSSLVVSEVWQGGSVQAKSGRGYLMIFS